MNHAITIEKGYRIMLERITTALMAYKMTYDGASEIYRKTRKEIDANYIGNLKSTKINDAKAAYEKTLADSREQNWNIIAEVLDDIQNKANVIVSRPVEPDFPATLETLRAISNPSERELAGIIERYKSNYMSYRAICDMLGGASKGFPIVTVDEVFDAVDNLRVILHSCIYGENTNTYNYRLMLQGDYMGNIDDLLSRFIDGRYDEAVEAMERVKGKTEITVDVTKQTKDARKAKPVNNPKKKDDKDEDEDDE